mmetsp:Transcript_21171/g.53030  ORF Transcript_21171/g.53030 Transcript_21171/m.53030 type:complete len:203 (-) Transcript_21171:260-868(-)
MTRGRMQMTSTRKGCLRSGRLTTKPAHASAATSSPRAAARTTAIASSAICPTASARSACKRSASVARHGSSSRARPWLGRPARCHRRTAVQRSRRQQQARSSPAPCRWSQDRRPSLLTHAACHRAFHRRGAHSRPPVPCRRQSSSPARLLIWQHVMGSSLRRHLELSRPQQSALRRARRSWSPCQHLLVFESELLCGCTSDL